MNVQLGAELARAERVLAAAAVERRKQGIYYTNQAEAAFMCREALRAWLERQCPQVPRAALLDLLYERRLPGSLAAAQRGGLLEALRRVQAWDPAMGSGMLLVTLARLLADSLRVLGEAPSALPEVVLGRLWGCDTHAPAVAVARLRCLEAAGAGPEALPLLEERLTVADALAAPDAARCDLVLANPPYVRHEHLSPALKAALQARWRTEAELTGRCDLYIYFFLLSVQSLRPGGVLSIICPNSWLDAGYGTSLQRFLLARTRVLGVYESAVRRSFPAAEVNTAIAVVQRANPDPAHLARFVVFRCAFGDVSAAQMQAALAADSPTSTPDLLVQPRPQARLQQEDGKWGGRYLRSPPIFPALLEQAGPRLVPLAAAVQVETYLNTGGADGFFIVRPGGTAPAGLVEILAADGSRRQIEERWVRPFLKSPSDLPGLLVDPGAVPWLLVTPPLVPDPASLVAAYIRWGEAQGFNARSGCSKRRPWWRLPPQAFRPGTVLWSRLHHDRHLVALNPGQVACTNFYALHGPDPRLLAAILNSSFYALVKELLGKTNFGGGVLKTDGNDIRQFPWIDTRRLTRSQKQRLLAAFEPLTARAIGPLAAEIRRPDRQELDQAVFDILGLSPGQRDALYEALCEQLRTRLARARS